ncbi:FAD-dependent oxidoreductase [Rhodohalobacter sp. SW132]|uniref:NAD(P)/FAD-dependent oxidoreductase n=1 Tax=Rhodohalobacter sp. SW132 TaxID=2293433 RepID=UPI000E22EF2F|nr:FAD-dependent oxidoreductase [Rhodohalobacter sp. SW132]REL33641.1 FAD-dependent oxidoreductase [Rhodohalobacter sp. SW132]
MVIGIIGAGISGLTAGRLLANAGHDVTILEKSRGYGGRMATRYAGKNGSAKMDHGLNYFVPRSEEFKEFTDELMDQELVKRWGESIWLYDGSDFHKKNPNPDKNDSFTATKGMNSIGKYLSRWVDVKTETHAGGLTYIGAHRSKKRSWMINLRAGNTFEADAVIIAAPAAQAYGLLQTTTNETNTLKIIREIDEVHYAPCYTLMAGYGDRELPEWEGIICKNSPLKFISNEATKKSFNQECSFVVQATPEYTRTLGKLDKDAIRKDMLDKLATTIGGWAMAPQWSQVHFWRYSRALKVLDRPYAELEFDDAPLALTGDYFIDNTVDGAYLSGFKLAEDWIKKYTD